MLGKSIVYIFDTQCQIWYILSSRKVVLIFTPAKSEQECPFAHILVNYFNINLPTWEDTINTNKIINTYIYYHLYFQMGVPLIFKSPVFRADIFLHLNTEFSVCIPIPILVWLRISVRFRDIIFLDLIVTEPSSVGIQSISDECTCHTIRFLSVTESESPTSKLRLPAYPPLQSMWLYRKF